MNQQTAIAKPWFRGIAMVILTLGAVAANAMTVNMGGDKRLDDAGLKKIYSETFDVGSDPKTTLFGLLNIGISKNGVWNGELADGVYRISNDSREDSVRYFYFDRVPGMPPEWTVSQGAVSVKVRVEKNRGGGAGLMFAYDPETKYYSALLMFGNGSFAFYRRTESGLNKIMSGSIKNFRKSGWTELAIVARGEFMDLYANGRILGSISYGTALPGYTGLIYAGKGDYVFDDFAVYTLGDVIPPVAVTKRAEKLRTPPATSPTAPANPLAPHLPEPLFSGRFVGNKITLELQANGAAYRGKIIYGTQSFTVTATAEGDVLHGTFNSEGHDFKFTARRKGDKIHLKTADVVYILSKDKSPSNPLAITQPRSMKVPPPAKTSSADLPAPQAPTNMTSLLYKMSMKLNETGESKQAFFGVDIEPMGRGQWLLTTSLSPDGKQFSKEDDFLVGAQGERIDPETRPNTQSDAIIYYWFPGTTEIDGYTYDVTERAGFWIYRSTEAPERRMVFEQASGRLVSAKSCAVMGCVFLELVPETPGR